MNDKKVFKRSYSRVALEGIIRAFVCGLIVGFSISFVVALVTFFVRYDNGFWLSIGIGLGALILATPVFYFTLFRPKMKYVAERVDRLGLDERLITMMELENDDSYIAVRQREDAKAKLTAVKRKQIKLSVLMGPLVAAIVLFVFAVSMTTVSEINTWRLDSAWLPTPQTVETVENNECFEVIYLAGEGGRIAGDEEQLVQYGKDGLTVSVVCDLGYGFTGWSDGSTDVERTDENVRKSITVTANFAEVEDQGSNDDPGSTESSEKPPDPEDETDEDPDGEDGPESGDSDLEGASGRYEEANQIHDGSEYYRDWYEYYYNKAMEILAETGEIPEYLRQLIQLYFGIII